MVQMKSGAFAYDLLKNVFLETGQFFRPLLHLLKKGSIADQGNLDRLDVTRPFLGLRQTPQKREVVDYGIRDGKGADPVFLSKVIDPVLDPDPTISLAQGRGGKSYQSNAAMSSGGGETDQIQSGAPPRSR